MERLRRPRHECYHPFRLESQSLNPLANGNYDLVNPP